MKEIIKKTIEYQNYKQAIIAFLGMLVGIFVVMCLPFLILYIQNENKQFLNAFIVFLVIDIMIFLPFFLYYLSRMLYILKIGNTMKIIEVELNDFYSTTYGLMIFLINIPDCNGTLMEKRSLCSMHGKLFNQYRNQKVNICYQNDYKYFFIIKK